MIGGGCSDWQVVFTDPYAGAPINRWTSPELDEMARSIQEDLELRLCASLMKDKFMQSTEVGRVGDGPVSAEGGGSPRIYGE